MTWFQRGELGKCKKISGCTMNLKLSWKTLVKIIAQNEMKSFKTDGNCKSKIQNRTPYIKDIFENGIEKT